MAEPSPAPASTTTSCSCSTSSRTPDGVSATRYSSVLISVGTPTFTRKSSFLLGFLGDQLAATEGEPEVDAIAGGVERAPGELLYPADAIAERVPVAVELARGPLPLPVALDERLERAHQLAAVGALAVLDGGEDRVAEEPQRVVVLERQQQLERAEVAERRQRLLGAVAVGGAGERLRLERAARLVERAPQLGRGDRAAGAGGQLHAGVARRPRAHALGQREQVLVGLAARQRQQRAGELAGPGREPARQLVAQRRDEPVLDESLDRPRRREHEHADALAQSERLEPPCQL